MQVKLATKLKLTDMLLGFLECFSLVEEKKPDTFFPLFLVLIWLNYHILSTKTTKNPHCLLFRALVISSIALGYFFQLFFLFYKSECLLITA